MVKTGNKSTLQQCVQRKMEHGESTYHLSFQLTRVVTHVPTAYADALVLFLSFAAHISPSPYVAAYEQTPVK